MPDVWQPKLDPYLDSELSADEMRGMDAHLRDCPSCASDALGRLQLRRANRMAGHRYTPSPEFRRRIEQQVSAKRHPSRRWTWIPALAMAAVVLLASAVSIGRGYEHSRSQQLWSELADLHVADLASHAPIDIVSSDSHTVKPWFQGKLPFTFDLPEPQGTGFTLVGGRMAYMQHEPGAHLLYDIGAQHVSVFIFRDGPEIGRDFLTRDFTRRVLSFHVESWATNGLRYFVFGDASPEAIERLCSLLKQASYT
jgi:anti-sigma factor RsiW